MGAGKQFTWKFKRRAITSDHSDLWFNHPWAGWQVPSRFPRTRVGRLNCNLVLPSTRHLLVTNGPISHKLNLSNELIIARYYLFTQIAERGPAQKWELEVRSYSSWRIFDREESFLTARSLCHCVFLACVPGTWLPRLLTSEFQFRFMRGGAVALMLRCKLKILNEWSWYLSCTVHFPLMSSESSIWARVIAIYSGEKEKKKKITINWSLNEIPIWVQHWVF